MTDKKRIVILADPLDNQYAGIHIYTKDMIRSVTAVDQKNEYILIREKKSDDFPHLQQIAVPNLPVWTGYQAMRLFVIFPSIIRKLKPDLVIEPAHFGPFNLPSSIRRMTIIHDLTPIKLPSLHRTYSQLLQKMFLRKILKRANLVLTNSKHTLKDVKEVYPFTAGRLKMIYPGKDIRFRPVSDEQVRKKYRLDRPYFLFVGTIEPRKNLLTLLESYARFRSKSHIKVQLLIVGQYGWKSKSFRTALEQHSFKEDILISGYVPRDELPAFYSGAVAMIYPSLYEGFGFPVLEAMACGAPCLVADNSSLPEVGGGAVSYFREDDPQMLSEQMIALSEDNESKEEMSRASLARADWFSWEKYASQFIEIIEKELQ